MKVFLAGHKMPIEVASGSAKMGDSMVTTANEMKEAGTFPDGQVEVLKSLKLWIKFVKTSKLAGMKEVIVEEQHVEGLSICNACILRLALNGV